MKKRYMKPAIEQHNVEIKPLMEASPYLPQANDDDAPVTGEDYDALSRGSSDWD